MDFKEILTVSGQPGLYKFVARSSNGIIVESVGDQKRMNVLGSTRVSALGEIALFTEDEDLPLEEVFGLIYKYENGKPSINPKEPAEQLVKRFGELVPSYDRDQVRLSDIKKILTWYNLLAEHNLLTPTEKKETEGEEKLETSTLKTPTAKKKTTPKAMNSARGTTRPAQKAAPVRKTVTNSKKG